MARIAPSRGSRATTEPSLVAERVAGDLLHVLADREGDVADVGRRRRRGRDSVAQLDARRSAPGELVVVGALDAVGAEVK